MVRKFVGLVIGRVQGLHTAALWLAGFSLLSQILAFLRDRLLAYHFGAGRELDLYYAAFEVPDLLFTTVASLVSASILVPLFAKWDNEKNEYKNKNFNSVFSVFSVLLVFSCLLCFFLMPYLVSFFFAGFEEGALSQVTGLSRIMLLSPLFLGLSNFFSSVTQYEKRFLLYSVSPLFYNFGIIGGTFLGAQNYGITAVVCGVCVGAFLHLAVQILWVFISGNCPRFTSSINWKEIKKIFCLSVPRTISLSASSLVGLIFVAIASGFPEGSIAAYTFAFNLQSVPLIIIGSSYSLAAFPTLATHYAKGEMENLVQCLSSGLRHIIFWSLPLTALFIILRAHIVRVILGSGAFGWSDTKITAALFAIFVTSIVFQSIQLFLTRTHYAFGKTKTPLFINIFSAISVVALAFSFIHYSKRVAYLFSNLAEFLKVGDAERLITLVLPTAFSFGALMAAGLLWYSLNAEIKTKIQAQIMKTAKNSFFVSVIMGFVAWVALRFFDNIFNLNSAIGVFLDGAMSGFLAIFAGVVFLWLTKNREFAEILKISGASSKN